MSWSHYDKCVKTTKGVVSLYAGEYRLISPLFGSGEYRPTARCIQGRGICVIRVLIFI